MKLSRNELVERVKSHGVGWQVRSIEILLRADTNSFPALPFTCHTVEPPVACFVSSA